MHRARCYEGYEETLHLGKRCAETTLGLELET